jgi:CSLREA domain-containing protein
MKTSVLKLFVVTFLFLSAFAVTSVYAQNTTLFTVNHNGDTNDENLGDNVCADSNGKCTLRAAIQEANVNTSQDAVNFALPVPSTIDLTLGELPITSNIYIAGPGARNLTIQRSATGAADFRIFGINYIEAHNTPLPITIRGLAIKNGKSTGDGGAIYIHYSTKVHFFDVAITNNTAAGSGGGIFNAGTMNLTRSLVASNTGNGIYSGGIINIGLATSVIANSTLTNNTGNQGGAVYNSGSLLLVNNTFSHNAALVGGSSIMNGAFGTVSVLNTIIGMDTTSPTSSLSGAFNSLGNNLVTDARNSTGFTNGTNGDQVSDNNAINPLLGNLADNGGQTDTRALLNGSPAINNGNNCVYNTNCASPVPPGFFLFTDQRLNYRRLGGAAVDVGAFESQTFTLFGSGGLGGFGFRNRSGGALLILTAAGTNEKQTRITNPFGNFFFNNLTFGEVYFLERKPKRAQERSGLLVFALDSQPSFPQPNSILEQEEIKIILPGIK